MSKCHVNLELYATVSIISEKTDELNDPPMALKLKSGRNRIPKAIPLPHCCPCHMPSSQGLVPVFHVLAPWWSSLKCLIHSFKIECFGAACLKSPVLFQSYIPLVRDNLINYYVPYFTPSITQDYSLERKKLDVKKWPWRIRGFLNPFHATDLSVSLVILWFSLCIWIHVMYRLWKKTNYIKIQVSKYLRNYF